METKLGEKLYELRKKHGYSQEALADILNVSRQAISKWECDEALPETTNLIALSKLYGISLDELIYHTPTVQSDNGISINGQNINITVKGKSDYENEIAKEIAEEVAIETTEQRRQLERTRPVLEIALEACYPVLITVAFLLWGFLVPNGWQVSWTLFITIPPFYSLIDCLRKKSATHFAYPVFVAFVYCFVGAYFGIWHPTWIVFVTIPAYYAFAEAIDKHNGK